MHVDTGGSMQSSDCVSSTVRCHLARFQHYFEIAHLHLGVLLKLYTQEFAK